MNTQFKRENVIMEFRKKFGNQLENVAKMAIFDPIFAVAEGDGFSAAFAGSFERDSNPDLGRNWSLLGCPNTPELQPRS